MPADFQEPAKSAPKGPRFKWRISHRTQYQYSSPVHSSFNELHLQPFSNEEQTLESFELTVMPAARISQYHDFYSNAVHHFEIPQPHSSLSVEAELKIATHPREPLALDAKPWPFDRIGEALRESRCHEFLGASRFVDLAPETWRLAVEATAGHSDTWQAALAIMAFVNGRLRYEPKSTTVHTHIQAVLEERRGVCQDFAHVMLGLCRTLKIPALYVSGYLATEAASATHAWTEIFIPGVGWRGLDPTHNRQTDGQYVKIAVGRDYADVPPVAGNYRGTTDRKLEVQVRVEPA